MKKLDPSKPVYSQIYDLLSVGEGPWQIQAYTTQYARNAQSVVSQIGYRKGTRYSTSKKGLVLTIKKVVSIPEPVYELPEAKVEEKETLYEVTFGSKDMTLKRVSPSTQDILLKAIAAREAAVSALTTELRYNQEVLKALIEVRDAAPF